VWSFCPVQVPNSTANAASSGSGTQASTATSSVSISNGQISARQLATEVAGLDSFSIATLFQEHTHDLELRQASSTNSGSSASTSPSGSSSTLALSSGNTSVTSSVSSVTASAASVVVPSAGASLYQIGPYQCTSTIDLPVFAGSLSEYLRNTSTTLAAILTFLELNLHVASSLEAPQSPALALNSSTDPSSKELLTNVLNVNLSSFLYTPEMLQNDRSNLNSSWLSVAQDVQPIMEYFNSTLNADGILTTSDGWPSESYVEFTKAHRLMVELGTVDPQVAAYNFSGDSNTIFPQDSFQANKAVTYNTLGSLEQGCFFSNRSTSISSSNNSWAITTDLQLPPRSISVSNETLFSISNLTDCGISPILNTTLSNTTADQDIAPYQSIAYNSIWSWYSNEPANVSSSTTNANLIRCALLDTTLGGRWRVADCTEKHFAACRALSEPYVWHLSSSRAIYSSSGDSCPSGTAFAAPRTGLENAYLAAAAAAATRAAAAPDAAFWVDFNSLDMQGCWVVGVNASCPYTESDSMTRRTVIVPTVAAVIVFVIAALTLFVKCAANRQNSRRGRRRRRGADGWDYEGVPS